MSLIKDDVRLEAIRQNIAFLLRQNDSSEKRESLSKEIAEYYRIKSLAARHKHTYDRDFYKGHWEKAEKHVEELENEIVALQAELALYKAEVERLK